MQYAGQLETGIQPVGKLETEHPELIFSEQDRRRGYDAIDTVVMPIDLYTRLRQQASVLDSHQANFFLESFRLASEFRDYQQGTYDPNHTVTYFEF